MIEASEARKRMLATIENNGKVEAELQRIDEAIRKLLSSDYTTDVLFGYKIGLSKVEIDQIIIRLKNYGYKVNLTGYIGTFAYIDIRW